MRKIPMANKHQDTSTKKQIANTNGGKSQITNPKFASPPPSVVQINSNNQIPDTKQFRICDLELGIYLGFDAWTLVLICYLVFVIWHFVSAIFFPSVL